MTGIWRASCRRTEPAPIGRAAWPTQPPTSRAARSRGRSARLREGYATDARAGRGAGAGGAAPAGGDRGLRRGVGGWRGLTALAPEAVTEGLARAPALAPATAARVPLAVSRGGARPRLPPPTTGGPEHYAVEIGRPLRGDGSPVLARLHLGLLHGRRSGLAQMRLRRAAPRRAGRHGARGGGRPALPSIRRGAASGSPTRCGPTRSRTRASTRWRPTTGSASRTTSATSASGARCCGALGVGGGAADDQQPRQDRAARGRGGSRSPSACRCARRPRPSTRATSPPRRARGTCCEGRAGGVARTGSHPLGSGRMGGVAREAASWPVPFAPGRARGGGSRRSPRPRDEPARGRMARRCGKAGGRHPCTIGRGGTACAKREGDGATPAGVHRITGDAVAARPDGAGRRPGRRPIGPADLWCDDPAHPGLQPPRARAPSRAPPSGCGGPIRSTTWCC